MDKPGQNVPVTPLGSQLVNVARQVDQLMVHLRLIRPGLLPPAVLDELARISTQVNSIKDQITPVEEQLGRMQALAGIGQVLISAAVYERVQEHVVAQPIEPVMAKGKRDPIPVYEIIDLK